MAKYLFINGKYWKFHEIYRQQIDQKIMLLLSNIKNYDLRLNKHFVSTDITHYTSIIYFHDPNDYNENYNYNYLLDLPDTAVFEEDFNLYQFSYHKNGELHRENGPAKISIYENGIILSKEWYKNGKEHRENGPSYIQYYSEFLIEFEKWHKN